MEYLSIYPVPTMLTVDETAARTGLPKHYIRQLVKKNKIVHKQAGRKILINLERLVDFLNASDQQLESPAESGTVRRQGVS